MNNEIRQIAKKYSDEKWKEKKSQRKQSEKEYYTKNGGTKLKTILFGDPNARASLFASGRAVKDAISKGDSTKLKDASEHLKDSIDPINSKNKKAS